MLSQSPVCALQPFLVFHCTTLFFSVVLNSSLTLHNYLFPSLEKRSSKSNKSQNVQQLACAILKCVNSLISLNVNLHEMSLVPSTSEHLLKCKHKHWIEILHVCLLHKRCPIQTNSVSFHQPNIWKKIVHIFVSFLKQTSYYLLYEGGNRNLENLLLFPLKQPFTILSTIWVPLTCEPKIIRMRPTVS